jgi:hypothetical protein
MVLSPSSARKKADRALAGAVDLLLLVLGEGVALQRPEAEADEGQRRDEIDPAGR